MYAMPLELVENKLDSLKGDKLWNPFREALWHRRVASRDET